MRAYVQIGLPLMVGFFMFQVAPVARALDGTFTGVIEKVTVQTGSVNFGTQSVDPPPRLAVTVTLREYDGKQFKGSIVKLISVGILQQSGNRWYLDTDKIYGKTVTLVCAAIRTEITSIVMPDECEVQSLAFK